MPEARLHVIRRRAASPPLYLLNVVAEHGDRTRVHGMLWDGVLNASPEDDTDGPSPIEALLAGVGACFVRNLRWVADGAHVEFARIGLRLAAERDDAPPAIRRLRLEAALETDGPAVRVTDIVERALRSGTITRTVARAAELEVVVHLNGAPLPVEVHLASRRSS